MLRYRADLDGLRAIAVLGVIFYHIGIPGVPGGFVGVDVFFVLSGYLITRILASGFTEGSLSVWDFYDRRIRRILPALVLVLVSTTVLAVLFLLPQELRDFGRSLAAAALSISNIWFWRQSGYFAPEAELQPLLHTWSLGIEEQFYIVFPILLMGLYRWARTHLALCVWVLFLSSLAWSVWSTVVQPVSAFYLLPSRAWELLAGSLLAMQLVPAPAVYWQREAGGILGLSLICLALLVFSAQTPFPGLAALAPCVGAALIIWSGEALHETQTWTARLLGQRVLVFTGLISYSLYLWHWPLLVFAKLLTDRQLTVGVQIGLLALTFVLSAASWWLVERPFRKGGWPWPTVRSRFAAAAGLVGFLLVCGVLFDRMKGLPQRLPAAIQAIVSARDNVHPERGRCHFDGTLRDRFENACVFGAAVPPAYTVIGDSHGAELSYALGVYAKGKGQSVRQLSASSCPPALGFSHKSRPDCGAYLGRVVARLAAQEPHTVIMMSYAAFWAGFPGFWTGFEASVTRLSTAGHRVIVVGIVPPHPNKVPVPTALAYQVRAGLSPSAYRFDAGAQAIKLDLRLKAIAMRNGAVFVPIMPELCPDGRMCRAFFDGTVMYFDDHHLSLDGARRIVQTVLAPVIWKEGMPGRE